MKNSREKNREHRCLVNFFFKFYCVSLKINVKAFECFALSSECLTSFPHPPAPSPFFAAIILFPMVFFYVFRRKNDVSISVLNTLFNEPLHSAIDNTNTDGDGKQNEDESSLPSLFTYLMLIWRAAVLLSELKQICFYVNNGHLQTSSFTVHLIFLLEYR